VQAGLRLDENNFILTAASSTARSGIFAIVNSPEINLV
jgi:hypothetical protein